MPGHRLPCPAADTNWLTSNAAWRQQRITRPDPASDLQINDTSRSPVGRTTKELPAGWNYAATSRSGFAGANPASAKINTAPSRMFRPPFRVQPSTRQLRSWKHAAPRFCAWTTLAIRINGRSTARFLIHKTSQSAKSTLPKRARASRQCEPSCRKSIKAVNGSSEATTHSPRPLGERGWG